MTLLVVGDATKGLSSGTSGIFAPLLPAGFLGATSVREEPTNPITLTVGGLADTVGGIFCRGSGVAVLTRKIARTLGITERTGVLWVFTLLRTLLVPDLRQTQEVVNCANVSVKNDPLTSPVK